MKYNNQREDYKKKYPQNMLATILDGKDPQLLVKTAEKIAREELLRGNNKVTTSQIRNIFGTVKKLEMKSNENPIPELVLLKPKLAYVVGRNDKVKGLVCLRDVLSTAIDLVVENKDKRFKNFCKFFEAILAYHKAGGGK